MKRILSIILTILLLTTVVAGSVFAGEGNGKNNKEHMNLKRFHSEIQVSRLGAAANLAEALELDPNNDFTENPFESLNISDEQYGYILALYNAGTLKGYPVGNFNPNGIVHRGQMLDIVCGISDEDDIESEDTQVPVWTSGASITLTVVSTSSVRLTWPDATDNVGVAEYKVYQNNLLIETLDSDENECTVTGLMPEREYTFKIKAVDDADNFSISLRKNYVTLI